MHDIITGPSESQQVARARAKSRALREKVRQQRDHDEKAAKLAKQRAAARERMQKLRNNEDFRELETRCSCMHSPSLSFEDGTVSGAWTLLFGTTRSAHMHKQSSACKWIQPYFDCSLFQIAAQRERRMDPTFGTARSAYMHNQSACKWILLYFDCSLFQNAAQRERRMDLPFGTRGLRCYFCAKSQSACLLFQNAALCSLFHNKTCVIHFNECICVTVTVRFVFRTMRGASVTSTRKLP
jgi:hypothetical protein